MTLIFVLLREQLFNLFTKKFVHKKITELNVLYLDSKLMLTWNDTKMDLYGLKLAHTFRGFGRLWGTCCGMATLQSTYSKTTLS